LYIFLVTAQSIPITGSPIQLVLILFARKDDINPVEVRSSPISEMKINSDLRIFNTQLGNQISFTGKSNQIKTSPILRAILKSVLTRINFFRIRGNVCNSTYTRFNKIIYVMFIIKY